MTGLIKDTEFRSSNRVGEQLEKTVQSAGVKLGGIAANLAHTATNQIKSGRDYLNDNPVKGAIIAATAGAIAGGLLVMLMHGRKR